MAKNKLGYVVFITTGHFFIDTWEKDLPTPENSFSSYVIQFGNISGDLSSRVVSPLQKGESMYFKEFLRFFNSCAVINSTGRTVILKHCKQFKQEDKSF